LQIATHCNTAAVFLTQRTNFTQRLLQITTSRLQHKGSSDSYVVD